MLNDDFADLQPGQPQTDEQKIDTILDLLASGFVNDPDLDLVRVLTLHHLLQFPRLPERATGIMQAILADEDDSDLVINRKVVAIDLLAHMGAQTKPALATLNDLLPLAESDRDVERWLALRAARAVWKITGDSESAVEVAEKLAEDRQAWLVIYGNDLLREIGSAE